ncbi:ral GTPase-activating protein subunit beta [Aulostomus maculatus]
MDQSPPSGRSYVSVLSSFPPSVGQDVAVAVVKPLGVSLGNSDTCSPLLTDKQVKWTMEVLCYGLSLPLDCDTVKHCVDVYTDWLMSLVSQRDSIPPPIIREPNMYVQKILRHLHNLFEFRSDQYSLVYLSLCQQVLRAVQSMARKSTLMTRDTWETLIHFLLRINHSILAPPTTAGAISKQLSQLSMEVLLEVWLLSCARCFPSRSLWQTCRQMVSSWRHQPVVVEQWSRVVAALTSRLLLLSFGPLFPSFTVPEEDAALIPADLDNKRVPQTWFRFLHMLRNPADLSRLLVDSSSPLAQEEMLRGGDAQLPHIFLTAMRVVGTLVDAFLGLTVINKEPTEQLPSSTGLTTATHFRDRLPSLSVAMTRSPFKDRLPSYGLSRPRSGSAPPTPVNMSLPSIPPSATSPPPHNRRQKTANVSKATGRPVTVHQCVSSSPHHGTSSSFLPPPSSILSSSPRPSLSPLRCNIDSLLHLFGSWLFDAALINTDSSLSERWVAGQAEACGTLCRIFACKKTAEDILPVYLSRFYRVLLQGLQVSEEMRPRLLASVLLNSPGLFCCDLKGVNLLLPPFISALEKVLLDRDLLRFKSFVSLVNLRRASILILLTLVPLPLQFGSVQSEVLLNGQFSDDDVTAGSFLSLRARLIKVLMGALQTETHSTNIQTLLAATLNLVQDSALLEAAGQTQQAQESQNAGSSRSGHSEGTRQTRRASNIQSDPAGILWVQFVCLLTQRLTSHWRNDSAVCFSVLEVLGGLAKVELRVEESEKREAVSAICRYIVFQCSRPPPFHSRDLHSIIVAAFSCLNTWLTQHPTMLDHQACLSEVLEIVELGIAGSKSRQEQEVTCKEEKELNPASQRVKEAAEATLSCVMQVSGACPFAGGSLDEDALIGCCSMSDRQKKFRYFVVDTSVILAMLEHPPGPEQACPALTVLIRGPSGRRAWTLQLHLQPREGRTHTQASDQCSVSSVSLHRALTPEHAAAGPEDAGIPCGVIHESAERVPLVKADRSIPALHEAVDGEMQQQVEGLRATLRRQTQVEARPRVNSQSVVMTTCRPPAPANHFQTARLFLSHLGLLTPETLKDPGTRGVPAQLVSLDSSLPGFSEDLRHLDQLPSTNRDSAFIFYMRAGQRTADEILKNVASSCSVSSHFLDFLSTLGWPAEAGHPQPDRTRTHNAEFLTALGESGGGVFDGEKFVLMYADALTRITFIVPSSSSHTHWSSSQDESQQEPASRPRRKSETSRGEAMKSSHSVSSFVIVWVELLEDVESFPVSKLLAEETTDALSSSSKVQLLFIHPLKTGLYQIGFHGNSTSKFSLVVPLVNGSVVSKRSLGILVRETLINCFLRRRLESDSAPPPHIKRKHMISDIILRYRSHRSEPAFYSALFHNP